MTGTPTSIRFHGSRIPPTHTSRSHRLTHTHTFTHSELFIYCLSCSVQPLHPRHWAARPHFLSEWVCVSGTLPCQSPPPPSLLSWDWLCAGGRWQVVVGGDFVTYLCWRLCRPHLFQVPTETGRFYLTSSRRSQTSVCNAAHTSCRCSSSSTGARGYTSRGGTPRGEGGTESMLSAVLTPVLMKLTRAKANVRFMSLHCVRR